MKRVSCPDTCKSPLRAAFFLSLAGLVFACAGVPEEELPSGAESEKESAVTEEPRYSLIVPTPQEVIYSGEAGEFRYFCDGSEIPELLFFRSPEDRQLYREGSREIPVEAGTYYALVRLSREEAFAEYRILKRPVRIEAAAVQEAVYNGDPRRVNASAEPGVVLSYSYYPNREFRDEAIRTAEENAIFGNPSPPQTEFKGYRRVDRAPIEQGTYYVWVYFPGDENHEAASAHVEFTILPPAGRQTEPLPKAGPQS